MIRDGIILKGIGGFYYVEAAGEIYECKARGIFRKERIMPLAGDRVSVLLEKDDKNSIDKIYERKNSFIRPQVANVDKMIIVVSTRDPAPNPLIIDRLTAIAVHKNVEPVIVFTKKDIGDPGGLEEIYKLSGIRNYTVSCVTGEGVDDVRQELSGCISVFTGNSGVGKSSLINALDPKFELPTGEISYKLNRGRHTTRQVELYHFLDGFIADTPGFSSIDFQNCDFIRKDELVYCFPEFDEYLGQCRFTSCAHVNDKGCRIVEAVKNGKISPSRHQSYVAMYNEVKDIADWEL